MHDDLFADYPLSVQEKELIDDSFTPTKSGGSQINIVANLYNIKKTEKIIRELIESNERLAKANGKYAFALNILTGALVFVALLQVIINIFFIN
jgi:hypothetical protein